MVLLVVNLLSHYWSVYVNIAFTSKSVSVVEKIRIHLLGFSEHKLSVYKMMLLVHPCLTRSLVEMALSSSS